MSFLTGKSSASGQYSYEARHAGNSTIIVAKMPEDSQMFRVVFTYDGESKFPIMKMTERDAQMLWAALNATAKKFNWEDYGDED